jgi:hypothetical protein
VAGSGSWEDGSGQRFPAANATAHLSVPEQLEAGYLTYLDWRILRALEGLAKRLWVYLESQTFKRSGIGEGAAALQLAPPLLQALGVTTKHQPHARRLLVRAGERRPPPRSRLSASSYDVPIAAGESGRWLLVVDSLAEISALAATGRECVT